MSFEPIENYGAIGNMRSIALVGVNDSIDFLCYPGFDSPTVFAALLDDERGGCFQIQPQLIMRVGYAGNAGEYSRAVFERRPGVAMCKDHRVLHADK